jgi:predicted esterase
MASSLLFSWVRKCSNHLNWFFLPLILKLNFEDAKFVIFINKASAAATVLELDCHLLKSCIMAKFKYVLWLFMIIVIQAAAQSKLPELKDNGVWNNEINRLKSDSATDADSIYKLIRSWNKYPSIERKETDYIFNFNDPLFGKIPVRVFIPAHYRNNRPTSCIILLHGATGRSKFSDIDSTALFEDDIFFKWLKNDDYIVVRPVADRDKKFSWASNRLNRGGGNYPHLTYKTLEQIVISLKRILNIDDDRVFAFGHSDGGDGAVGFSAYAPNLIASSVAYNTMMLCLFSPDYHIRNIKNRPLYAVHSDLDNLRPIQQERIIIDSLKKIGTSVSYHEYAGYEHEDGHLNLDIPLVRAYLKGTDRTPFANRRY